MSGGADDRRLLTANDLAYRWQVKTAHVQRLTLEGRIACVQLGRYRRYPLDVIEAFEANGGTLNRQEATRSNGVHLRDHGQASASKHRKRFRRWVRRRKATVRWDLAFVIAFGISMGNAVGVMNGELTLVLLVQVLLSARRA